MSAALREAGDPDVGGGESVPEIRMSFRSIPRYELLADEVYRLHTEKRMNLCAIGRHLNCGDNVACVPVLARFAGADAAAAPEGDE